MTGRIQPAPSSTVLAELAAPRCVHGEVATSPPRCPLCRTAGTVPDPADAEPPATEELPDGWHEFASPDQTVPQANRPGRQP